MPPEVAEAIFIITRADAPGDYIVATGESHALQEMVQIATELVGLSDSVTIESDPSLMRKAEVLSTELSAKRIGEKLGWKSAINFPTLWKLLFDDSH